MTDLSARIALRCHTALWQRVFNDLAYDDETLRQYFADNLFLSELAVEQARHRFPEVFGEIEDVRQVYRELETSTSFLGVRP